MAKHTPPLPGINPPTRRLKSLVRRALLAGEKAGELYGKKHELLLIARQNGLVMNTPIEVDGEQWQLVEPDGKFVRFSRFELKKVPKVQRTNKAEAEAGSTASGGVMHFIIHYLVRGPVKDLHFDYVSDQPVTRANLDSFYEALARDAQQKTGALIRNGQAVPITSDAIIVANIIPIPSGESNQIGGS
jgi:hypothetical protein